jgi:hypothetical protein
MGSVVISPLEPLGTVIGTTAHRLAIGILAEMVRRIVVATADAAAGTFRPLTTTIIWTRLSPLHPTNAISTINSPNPGTSLQMAAPPEWTS